MEWEGQMHIPHAPHMLSHGTRASPAYPPLIHPTQTRKMSERQRYRSRSRDRSRSRSRSPDEQPPYAAIHYYLAMGVRRCNQNSFLCELRRTYFGMLFDINEEEADSDEAESDRMAERNARQAEFFENWRSQLVFLKRAWSRLPERVLLSEEDKKYLDNCEAYLTVWELEQDNIGEKLGMIRVHINAIKSCTGNALLQEHKECWLECSIAYQQCIATYPNADSNPDGSNTPFIPETLADRIYRLEEDQAHAEAAERDEIAEMREEIREDERAYAEHNARKEYEQEDSDE